MGSTPSHPILNGTFAFLVERHDCVTRVFIHEFRAHPEYTQFDAFIVSRARLAKGIPKVSKAAFRFDVLERNVFARPIDALRELLGHLYAAEKRLAAKIKKTERDLLTQEAAHAA